MTLRPSWFVLVAGLGVAGVTHAQQPPEPPGEDPAHAAQEAQTAPAPDEDDVDVEPKAEPTPPIEVPERPFERLEKARSAFRRADYAALVPLLEDIADDDSPLPSRDQRTEARQLLGVGFFFDAQQVTDPKRRQVLLEQARVAFLTLLRENPSYALDPLIFPASVVELFEDVREEHAEELDRLIRAREGADASISGELQTLYVERAVEQRVWALNFAPFGIGQFQNESHVKGTLFAVGQALGLAVNVTGYVQGFRACRPNDARCDAAELADAKQWRIVQYTGLGIFAGLYALSVMDGLFNFERHRVRIRTLDAPPPELEPQSPPTGALSPLPLGLGLELDW